jgi:hypothetical protein
MGEVGMGQSFGLIFIQQDDIAGLSLLSPDLKPKTDTVCLRWTPSVGQKSG